MRYAPCDLKFDEADRDLVEGHAWYSHQDGYAYNPKSDPSSLHRAIAERMLGRAIRRGECVDHANRDKLDNRRENLRVGSYSLNLHNKGAQSNSQTGIKGVTRRSTGWMAQLMVQGRVALMKHFQTEAEAIAAVEAARSALKAFDLLYDES